MKVFAVVCLLVLLVAAEAVQAEEPQQLLQAPHRKLAQPGYYYGRNGRRRDRRDDADAQFARNQAAAINTQYAIRNAEESGANPYATRAAADVGSFNSYLATQRSNWVFTPLAGPVGK